MRCLPMAYKEKNMFQSIVSAVASYADRIPEKRCIIDNMGVHTYQEVWKDVEYAASYYKDIGIEKGNCVIVECTQDARFLVCDLACQLAGCIFVPIEHRALQERCRDITEDVGAKLLVYESDYDVPIKKTSMSSLFENRKESPGLFPVQEINPDDVAEILYTTGTTGKPKGIVITNLNNVAIAENVVYGTEMSKDSVELVPLPLNHSHGLRSCYAHLINGSTTVLFEGVTKVKDIFEAIDRYGITAMDLSPSAAKVLLKLSKGNFVKYRDQIEYIQIGTAALDEDIKKQLCEMFHKSRLYNFYGSTESGRSCVLDFNREQGKIGCIGIPSKHVKFIITDENRNIFTSSADRMGLIATAGIMNMKGYWKDEWETEKVMQDGYIYTNDLGYIDADGSVYMLGRADDVINYKGIKIAPEEIEAYAVKYENVLDCACVPVKDTMCGQIPCLFLVVQDKGKFDKRKCMDFLTTVLDADKIPRKIEIVDQIPRTANGKIQRKKMLDMGI